MVYRQESHHRTQHLAREARRVVELIHRGPVTGDDLVTADRTLIQVVDPQRRIVAASPGMRGRPPVNFDPPVQGDDRRDGRTCSLDVPGGRCFQVVAFRSGSGDSARYVYSIGPAPGMVPRPGTAALLALTIPLISGLVGFATWVAAGRTLRPVTKIRQELDEITATDLERRVPVPGRTDEIGRLATSVNATLDRLEGAVAKQRGFVSDVSHELRSPLTGLRMELELALDDPGATDLRDTLAATLKNAERLQAVLEDLLALARLDARETSPAEPVDLHELTDQEVLRRPRRARVTVVADGPVIVRGGRLELGRLLTNLIDNADRHADSTVSVVLRYVPDDRASVEVVDDGTGIAPEDRERVFERFTRLAEGRHRDAGGTGLGLAIARDIAHAQHGSLTITDRDDGERGARFVLILPCEPPATD
ncbi:HAMP domain-containing histidine kinase [Actinomadura barringtoniae]|uniref:histidine kinase n=2 Tax=Actinomadura barringtoniae TaxID=1427535 RepID=A0A939P770_9ACTN|nr:HAMP domain-containing histidine kinase [Actinomadura barringtoniae]